MKKNVYLEKLKEYDYCFDYEEAYFELLADVPIDQMGLLNPNIYTITPLLDQISLYALAFAFVSDAEYEDLKGEKLSFNRKYEARKVMEICYDYMNSLVDKNCMHPSVLIYRDLVTGGDLYDDMMDDIYYSFDYIKDNDIFDFLEKFINDVDGTMDEEACISDADLAKIEKVGTSIELLKLLSIHARNVGLKKLLVSGNYTSYSEQDNWVRFYDDYEGKLTLKFVDMAQRIQEELDNIDGDIDYEDEDEVESLNDSLDDDEKWLRTFFSNILFSYGAYKQIQFDYLKSSYKEAKILEKCNKM